MTITICGMHIGEFDYEPFEIDESELTSPPDEAPFGRAAFELHKDLADRLPPMLLRPGVPPTSAQAHWLHPRGTSASTRPLASELTSSAARGPSPGRTRGPGVRRGRAARHG